ncbi:protein of unknown function [Candidatus Hydrogenisulfobacillus filiaventi]|uniref:Uncharacterized protein n=1 Tax=Candidatus Hydrogenisulfobacillus filiaventi TaxID=2707344 RepID=A0A6F8ZF01_9FIRM|nr:hypothetical protein [Bacillota bacterium]CAB1128274.1 protein of unknown function [Candidatus Hydrogenisulfobacillus filiaventi]
MGDRRRIIILGERAEDWPPALRLLRQLQEGPVPPAVGFWVLTGWPPAWWADDGSGGGWLWWRQEMLAAAEETLRAGRRQAGLAGYGSAGDRIWVGAGRAQLATALVAERVSLLVAASPGGSRLRRLLAALIVGGPVPVAVAVRSRPPLPFPVGAVLAAPEAEGRGEP